MSQALLDLSVVIITRNEERRLPACLGSLPQGAEVVVLDSESTDGTRALAEAAGCRVAIRAFTNHKEQKNAAVAMATRKWVLSVDADEVLGEDLARAVVEACRTAAFDAYRVRRRLVFMGRVMRFGKTVDHPLRLFLRGRGSFESDIHETLRMSEGSRIGQLGGELRHYSYDDITDYFRRFNDYTSRIADNHARAGKRMPWGPVHWLRPAFEFTARYVFRLGFLDGYPGFCYALFSSLYTFVKYAKLREKYGACASGTSPRTAGTAPSPSTR